MRLNPILTTRTYALTALSLSNFVRTIVITEDVYIFFAVTLCDRAFDDQHDVWTETKIFCSSDRRCLRSVDHEYLAPAAGCNVGQQLKCPSKVCSWVFDQVPCYPIALCDAAIAIPQTATALGKTKGTDYWKYSDCSQRLSVFLVAPVYTLGGLVPPS